MPELPDVEVFRRHLAHTSLYREISEVRDVDPTVLRGLSRQGLGRALRGQRLAKTHRPGKHLFAALSDSGWRELHFGMTGRVEHSPSGGPSTPASPRSSRMVPDSSSSTSASSGTSGWHLTSMPSSGRNAWAQMRSPSPCRTFATCCSPDEDP